MGWLTAMQLIFTNNIKSPLFQDPDYKDRNYDLTSVDVDTTKKICKVGIKKNQYLDLLFGLRLLDDKNEYIVNVTWNYVNSGEWTYKDIPIGEE